ncbi:MAG: gliding motility-associated C-terminal domain-containing protein [Flavobacteriales bacterium]|nr:gliding motility-associated C-terminal domain-containing protein [Flavobacteriales bacterium]MDW8410470.1 gliding motility-associated C-terminal domain-containing protein [Flavobacteriales bacterium]
MEQRKTELLRQPPEVRWDKAPQPEQDCPNALPICSDIITQPNSYSGTGFIPNEINGSFPCGSANTPGYVEKNSVWYIFTAQTTGILQFTLSPLNLSDDYDWAVFRLPSSEACPLLYVDPSLRVSCNFSAIPGNTGPNGQPGPQNEAPIFVTAGETYVINVSNFSSTQSGYILNFTGSTATLYDTVPPVFTGAQYVCNNYGIRLSFNEPIKCATIASDGTDFLATNLDNGIPIPVVGAVGVGCSPFQPLCDFIDVMVAPSFITQPTNVGITLQTGSDGNTIGDKCENMMTFLNAQALLMPKPTVDFGPDRKLCAMTAPWEYPLLDAGNPGSTYQWTLNGVPLNHTEQTYQVTQPGYYTVTVNTLVTADPCIITEDIDIQTAVDFCDKIPNALSPNGDGINDLYLKGFDITILNRWGDTLYQGGEGWDGTYNGQKVSNGTYYAIIRYTDLNGEKKTITTPVTVVH